jgi:histidine triad (HIT) family protein
MECFFCKLAQGEISPKTIYEDDNTLAFLDIHPRSKGHTLVIPKKHAAHILDLPSEDVSYVFQTVKRVTGMIQDALHPDGFTIGINHGSSAGQEVQHLHVHIMPRWEGDKGYAIQHVVENPSEISLEEVQKIIKKS